MADRQHTADCYRYGCKVGAHPLPRPGHVTGGPWTPEEVLAGKHLPVTAAVPDPREPKPCPRCGTVCVHDGWGHVHPNGIGIGSCAVPDPRFRDQLAEALRGAAHVCGWDVPCPCADWPDEQYDATVHATTVSAGHVNEVQGIPEALADALLPVVDEIAGERAAEAEAERDYWKTEVIELTSMMSPRAEDLDAEAGR